MMRNLSPPFLLLDGGMGRELERMGAPFGQPEWSAKTLMESPELVLKAHEAFCAAGCHILTTSNYAVVPFHIGEECFRTKGQQLIALAGRLARKAGDMHGCHVAGSIPPVFGSYRPDLFRPEQAQALLQCIVEALEPFVDIWLAETISSLHEAQAVFTAINAVKAKEKGSGQDRRPIWFAFTLEDCQAKGNKSPRLRSGEDVVQAVYWARKTQIDAILFNCSQPEVMASALTATNHILQEENSSMAIGVYANGFPCQETTAQANASLQVIRQDITPERYLRFAQQWRCLGASIIGGCCGIGPEHIKILATHLQ